MAQELVLLVGLQASGKSTFFRERFAATHAHVSKDLLRNNRRPERRQRQLIAAALAAGRSVVVDNTNPTAGDRKPLLALARQAGARTVGYYFESRVQECLERNRLRAGREAVPEIALFATIQRLERPRRAEGFDALYYVRLASGGFVVSAWDEGDGDEAP